MLTATCHIYIGITYIGINMVNTLLMLEALFRMYGDYVFRLGWSEFLQNRIYQLSYKLSIS